VTYNIDIVPKAETSAGVETIFSDGIPFVRKDSRATIPTRATDGSAGFDLYAMDSAKIIGLEGMVAIDIGIGVIIPRGHRGSIAMRSGLAKNQHLIVGAGVIDEDFRGTLMVLVACVKNDHIYTIKPGERFAQLIIEPIYKDCSMPTRNRTVARIGADAMDVHAGWGSTGKY
jgi:dUTP pyrophosphatase